MGSVKLLFNKYPRKPRLRDERMQKQLLLLDDQIRFTQSAK